MGIIEAFNGAISSTFADQWKDIITVDHFKELEVVRPGEWRGVVHNSNKYTNGIITNGSKIYIPQNTAAIIYKDDGIEEVITKPGGYIYNSGEKSLLNGDGIWELVVKTIEGRFTYGGIASDTRKVAFLNLRELGGIKFGTKGPLMYHDKYYDVDLEIIFHGVFTLKIVRPTIFVDNYLPVNVMNYNLYDQAAKSQLVSEVLEAVLSSVNSLSSDVRISEIPGMSQKLTREIINCSNRIRQWENRFGLKVIDIALESIELTEESRKLVQKYSESKMGVAAYENISELAGNIAYKQAIGTGIKEHGLGDGGAGLIMGMNITKELAPKIDEETSKKNESRMDINEQIETLKKLKELLDSGILTQQEFENKKKEIMNL